MKCGSAADAVKDPTAPTLQPPPTATTFPATTATLGIHPLEEHHGRVPDFAIHAFNVSYISPDSFGMYWGDVILHSAFDRDAMALHSEDFSDDFSSSLWDTWQGNDWTLHAEILDNDLDLPQTTSALRDGAMGSVQNHQLLLLAATYDFLQTQPPGDHARRMHPLAPLLTPVPSGPNLVDFPYTGSVPSKQAPSSTVFPPGNVAHMSPIASGRPRGRRTFARRPDLNRHSRVADTDRDRAIIDCHLCHRATHKPLDNRGSRTLSSEAACHSDNSFCDTPDTAEIGLGQLKTSPVDSRPRPSNSEKRIRDWNRFAAAASMWLALPDLLGSFFEWTSHQPCPEPGRFQPIMMLFV